MRLAKIAGGLALAYLAASLYAVKKMLDLRWECDFFDDDD